MKYTAEMLKSHVKTPIDHFVEQWKMPQDQFYEELADALNYAVEQAKKPEYKHVDYGLRQDDTLGVIDERDESDMSNYAGQHAPCATCYIKERKLSKQYKPLLPPKPDYCLPCQHNKAFINRLETRVAKRTGALKQIRKRIEQEAFFYKDEILSTIDEALK